MCQPLDLMLLDFRVSQSEYIPMGDRGGDTCTHSGQGRCQHLRSPHSGYITPELTRDWHTHTFRSENSKYIVD